MTILKKSDREHYVRMYDLNTYAMVFEELIGGHENSFIKCKDIE